jgi:hypothetical protein
VHSVLCPACFILVRVQGRGTPSPYGKPFSHNGRGVLLVALFVPMHNIALTGLRQTSKDLNPASHQDAKSPKIKLVAFSSVNY